MMITEARVGHLKPAGGYEVMVRLIASRTFRSERAHQCFDSIDITRERLGSVPDNQR